MASSSWAGYGPAALSQGPSNQQPMQLSGSSDRQKKPQSRQLLSCTKCRERKVKCDRTKPCSACCARGHPKECEFVVGEGNDYSPIQQSYEIRKLRAENQRLKERLQHARLTGSGDDDEDDESGDRKGPRGGARASSSRQRRFKTGERIDNLYFGTPGLANIVSDFANLQFGSQSLTHTMPKGRDMYAPTDGLSAYPFPMMHGANSASDLARALLQSHDLVFKCLDFFQRRAQSCYFPHTPDEVTKKEVERFLADAERNAEKFPDMLALIFATIATGMQMGVYDKNSGWQSGVVEQSRETSDVYTVAASMQALRLASFLNTPTLLGIQSLLMIGPYLTNSGRFLDAWTLFGTTIRLAHSIGLHRDPKILDPTPPLRESSIRRTLWWWMLHMDQQYSVTLGRPLGISGFGDCPPPEPLTTNPTILRLGDFVDHFTILARQILSSDGMMNVGRIDEFTDKLIGLWDTMPEALQFNESWTNTDTLLPDWPLEVMSAMLFMKVHSFLILINRQRVERTQGLPGDHSPPVSMMPPARPSTSSYGESRVHAAPVRGRELVINSSVQLLQAFVFFWMRRPEVLICWTVGQQAFNACMILILDAWETENAQNEWLVEYAFSVFKHLEEMGVHKLAELAVWRISDGIAMLGHRRQQREQASAAMSRRQPGFQPTLQIDTAAMPDFSGEAVMGSTGMYILEDPGLQAYSAPAFQPLSWTMAGSAHHSNSSNPTTPNIPSPIIPVSQMTAAPFPAMSSPAFISPIITCGPMMTSSYSTSSLPTRMGSLPAQQQHYQLPPQQRFSNSKGAQQTLTPINMAGVPLVPMERGEAQQTFSQARGPSHQHHGGAGSRATQHHHQRPDRPPRSQQRRK